MNRASYDEYEEVESPFASKSSDRPTSNRERLRGRKNVFNRPFATDSTQAPTYFETTSTRRAIGTVDNTDLIEHRQSDLVNTEIEYLEEDEEEVEKKPVRKTTSSSKSSSKLKKNLLSKIGWSVIGLLVLRLIFMDRGVWDYFRTEGVIREKLNEHKSIQLENAELKTEISRIQVDKSFQRQLAKEHLGVIAADEFLILFAGESQESSDEVANQL